MPEIIVTVARDLEDLIPVFFKNRLKEVEALRTALGTGDFAQLAQLGHRMKGVGNSYGFELVSILGKRIEDAAKVADGKVIEAGIAEYAEYLASVKVVYG